MHTASDFLVWYFYHSYLKGSRYVHAFFSSFCTQSCNRPSQALHTGSLNTHSSSNTASILQRLVVVALLVTQSCPTICDPMGCSPPGSSVHGILQARILEWVAIPFSRGSLPKDQTWVSHIAGGFFTTVPPEKPKG